MEELNEKIKLYLPTEKQHVSYSEVKDWLDCSYKHYLKHVKKINLQKPTIHIHFGKAVHSTCEEFLKTKNLNFDICKNTLLEAWENELKREDYTKEQLEEFGFNQKTLDYSLNISKEILEEIPGFMEETFPNWEYVEAEHMLYENYNDYYFKGFIDGIIKCKVKNKYKYWILDWKTSNIGWLKEKKCDKTILLQLMLYKLFYSRKMNIPLKDIGCAFVILKKSAKKTKHCELFKVSVGDVTISRSEKTLRNMFATVNNGINIKNKDSCKYCDYNRTKYCDGNFLFNFIEGKYLETKQGN